jgi:hypothetical protein
MFNRSGFATTNRSGHSDPALRRERSDSMKWKFRRPISEKKLKANRANAKRSTGPKTLAGKVAVRGNAVRHGLRSNMLIARSEECVEDFNDILLSIRMAGKPKTDEEEILLEEIAEGWWKLRRLMQPQGKFLNCICDPESDRSETLRLLRRYEGSLSKQLSVRIRRWVSTRKGVAIDMETNL